MSDITSLQHQTKQYANANLYSATSRDLKTETQDAKERSSRVCGKEVARDIALPLQSQKSSTV